MVALNASAQILLETTVSEVSHEWGVMTGFFSYDYLLRTDGGGGTPSPAFTANFGGDTSLVIRLTAPAGQSFVWSNPESFNAS